MTDSTENIGKVYLVGAGPGDVGLITIRGTELLKAADCIIIDKLANPDLLKYAGADAEIIYTPKRTGLSSVSQEQINKLMLEKALAGKTVVRLKGGDPCIFGRVAEEAKLLADAGIEFEIVPGITAGIAAAEYAGIFLTDRTSSSQVIFVTGREADDKESSNIDWPLLAKFRGTIVFYMAMNNLKTIIDNLINNGLNPDTPAAVIENATQPNQKVVQAIIGHLYDKCLEERIEPPAIIVIGQAAETDQRFNWFMNKPLFGKKIAVTRDAKGNADFACLIAKSGGNPILFETIKIKPLTQSNDFLEKLAKLSDYDWIIFTSANGVEVFFDCISRLGKDARIFGTSKIAAIGSHTASVLSGFGIKADFMPSSFTSQALGTELSNFTSLKGKHILLLRSALADNSLRNSLADAGAIVEQAAVYTVIPAKHDLQPLLKKIQNNTVDWLTFASSSSVKLFFEQIPPDLIKSGNIKIASIGPLTSEQLKNIGIRVDIEAEEHSIDGLLTAIESTYKRPQTPD